MTTTWTKAKKLWGFQCPVCYISSMDTQTGGFPLYDKAPKCCGGVFMTPYEIIPPTTPEWECPKCHWRPWANSPKTDLTGTLRCRMCDSVLINCEPAPYKIKGGPQPGFKCSACKWKPKPGSFIYSNKDGCLLCPECNKILPGKRFI